jgi:YhcN/YlaJ family sporulation lipoprotein
MKHKNIYLLLIVLVAVTALVISGCATPRDPARRPAPPENTPQQPSAPPRAMPNKNPDIQQRDRIAEEAEKVEEVRNAHVVINENKAYVGLDLNGQVEKNKAKEIERKVHDRIKNVESDAETFYVTADVNMTMRIRRVADGLDEGRPLSGFVNELEDIEKRITPLTR